MIYLSWIGMFMLCVVSTLDWNFNVNRPIKIGKDGQQLFKSKVKMMIKISCQQYEYILQVDRQGKKTVVVEVKEPKSYEYHDLIYNDCIKCLEDHDIPDVTVTNFFCLFGSI